MDAPTLVALVDLLEEHGIDVWLDGGWGVDALLGDQVREHDDLDLVAELAHSQLIIETLEDAGYELVDGAPPKSFVLVDVDGRQVDVHPVVFDEERGGGVYVMGAGEEWVYPAEGFSGRGLVAGRPVRCLVPRFRCSSMPATSSRRRTIASCSCCTSASDSSCRSRFATERSRRGAPPPSLRCAAPAQERSAAGPPSRTVMWSSSSTPSASALE